jgi:hypothetical protein
MILTDPISPENGSKEVKAAVMGAGWDSAHRAIISRWMAELVRSE